MIDILLLVVALVLTGALGFWRGVRLTVKEYQRREVERVKSKAQRWPHPPPFPLTFRFTLDGGHGLVYTAADGRVFIKLKDGWYVPTETPPQRAKGAA